MQTEQPAPKTLDHATWRGQAAYTPFALSLYDFGVLGVSNAFLWRCPTPRLLDWYASHVSDRHLEAGVGTAYLPDHTRFPSEQPRITLMDLNPNTLTFGARRLRRYRPRTRVANLLEPIEFDETYASVAVNYVLHCLPGTIQTKASVFTNLKRGVAPGGVIFGATLLGGGIALPAAATRMMALYNRIGIFTNLDDDLEGLRGALRANFDRYTIEVVGCAALFAGYC